MLPALGPIKFIVRRGVWPGRVFLGGVIGYNETTSGSVFGPAIVFYVGTDRCERSVAGGL